MAGCFGAGGKAEHDGRVQGRTTLLTSHGIESDRERRWPGSQCPFQDSGKGIYLPYRPMDVSPPNAVTL